MSADGIPGITILGATSMLQAGDDAVPIVSREPVYLSAEYIDRAIATGTLQAGAFNRVNVAPPPDQWPEKWKHLKE